MECIASDCSDCKHPTDAVHEAVYEAVVIMFHACQDLIACPSSMWPKSAKAMVQRYLPLMKLQWGETDQDVKNVEKKILSSNYTMSEVTQSFQRTLEVSEGGVGAPKAGLSKAQSSASKSSIKVEGKEEEDGGSTKKKKKRGK